MRSLSIICFLLFAIISISFSQSGFIRGTVYDNNTGESLPGVSIIIDGTTTGTMTDLDGKFNLTVSPGKYTINLSFVSYETIVLNDIEVPAGKPIVYDNLRMNESTIELSTVVITKQMVRNTETALLTMKRTSPTLMDGISASNLKKIGDSDAAGSMKRVTGVSVSNGKYVFVRGLGDRYTKTTLNGMDIPGLDPDRNSLQMDIFPTNVIDNIIVLKSFTAELPADFTGGVIDIELKDFPETRKGNVFVSTGYNPAYHFNDNYLTYDGGKTDYLGYDDGTRAIPATTNIPQFADVIGKPNSEQGLRYRDILANFNPNLAAYKERNLMDYSIGASVGNQIPVGDNTWGYNLAFSYKNNTEFVENAEYGKYGLSGDRTIKEMEVREFQKGNFGATNVFISGLAGIAYKTKTSKYRLNLIHLQNGETKAGIYNFVSSDLGTIFEGYQHNLDYSQRSLSNLLLAGKHNLLASKWELEWKISPTFSMIEDPDIRFTRYVYEGVDKSNLVIGTESGFPERIWRELSEYNIASVFHAKKETQVFGEKAQFRFGATNTYKERDFNVRNFALNLQNIPLTGDPNEVLAAENLWPMNGKITQGTHFETSFIPYNPNMFNANSMNTAGYLSADVIPLRKLKTIVGMRIERFEQKYTGRDQLGKHVLDNETVLDDINVFPSLNLIYSLTGEQNLRLSASQTIARPSFKEMSYAQIYDPVSGRTFIGGMSRDANDFAGIVYWDGNITSTNIINLDLRWELFQKNNQMISVSGFFKQFEKPIEIVQFATQVGSFQPRNVGDGEVLGAELEIRQNLNFISVYLTNFSVSSNLTFTQSKIELSKTEYDSRVENAREGQKIEKYRDMAGQAPYIINAGLSYDGGERGFWERFEAGLYYNMQGQTLQYVGIADRPDIYSNPFHSLNFNSNYTVDKNKRIQVGLKIDNILDDKNEAVYKSFQATDQYFTKLYIGRTFQFKVSYNFF